MAIIAIYVEWEAQYDDGGSNEAVRWLHWADAETEKSIDAFIARAALTDPTLRLRKVKITREVYGDDSPP